MTATSPTVIEIKLDRLIDDMRLLRSQMIAYDRQLKGIEASLNSSEPSEQQPDSKSRPWFAAQPGPAALISGEFLVISGEGQAYSEQEADSWLGQTGWKKIEKKALAGPTSLIVAEAVAGRPR
jgi:hypothetical protein